MFSKHGSSKHKSSGRHSEKTKTSSRATQKAIGAREEPSKISEPWTKQESAQSDVSEGSPEPMLENLPPPSFLFQVNQLPINQNYPIRSDPFGHSLPPMNRNRYDTQVAGHLYRWTSNGKIARATGLDYYNNAIRDRSGQPLTTYSTRTVFWCNNWIQYLVTEGDASARDMEEAEFPDSAWWALSFDHDNDKRVSRVTESAVNPILNGVGGEGAKWVSDLGLSAYVPRDGEPAQGLSGNLATLFGMVAMSCSAQRFDSVMAGDPLRGNTWRGHARRDGRTDERAVVVHIYLDPDNQFGSTRYTLRELEWRGPPLIR
ncbi:hypothetical protein VTL71DRAFT_5963 [Oculimacula yallundae]|uniref:Uncharacterized protein n=1 Tax=Oculimacula yallundae TaxID=86028 RepID=A0ABR4BZ02_9HELO